MSVDISIGNFDCNITYNLSKMLTEAFATGNYWLDELQNNCGDHLLSILDSAILRMVRKPDYFKQFDAANGWGTYEHALPWLIELRQGVAANIEHEIYISK